jgi:hypothetical protein
MQAKEKTQADAYRAKADQIRAAAAVRTTGGHQTSHAAAF